ncbi:Retrovirus-related Pol polyprotein from transposon gypsy [Eumeta japonica]|uniref:Retrovirus-related Pol polyprotein from transposon gypsy n=1 Tax=Eumeta variegata TaxID=151549 RepID=A0A4C1SMM9_EUMVA|nr:Retrovirus-related Pol polyprotein from transposon gypsy [Eumeta japonica]
MHLGMFLGDRQQLPHTNCMKERLDFAYADKRSVFTLERELSALTQGSGTIIDFYNVVEEKLNLIINKTIMTYGENGDLVESLNQKYRQDALRVFISGLKKPLCDVLFSCKPSDMLMALALAQEMATNQSRYKFARDFNGITDRQGPHRIVAFSHRNVLEQRETFNTNNPLIQTGDNIAANEGQFSEDIEEDQINFRPRSLLPYVQRGIQRRKLRFLVDTGSSKNYIKDLDIFSYIINVKNPILVKSAHERVCEIGANLDAANGILKYEGGIESLKFLYCNGSNISMDTGDIPDDVRGEFFALLERCKGVFASPNETLPYNTNVVASIRTKDNEPRTKDDILREEIGKSCHVYIDDIIRFSDSKQKHIDGIALILGKLYSANMRVSMEKSKFLKQWSNFGFSVSTMGIKTCPDKIGAIVNYQIPSTLRGLRSFLGLCGYYRRS